MQHKTYFAITGTFFLIIALVHLLRVLNGWGVTVGSVTVSTWISWLPVILGGYLAYWGMKLSK
ncbi:MAG: hypothetical protein A3B10_03550 [Candidatus Doudnabacteria bacterium RIFCSPLOWO2_01_FULL_44_21]|uniref:Uncharacterized protein n=1 Tax=Candidatus Doudnabacteria bacterium RIFCSPLOWO2_01_FULL_44_21 TaxID=1817841 RepID=A0A1F5PY22_9BACT|nr:MAG: hypothetical protein A3B95_02295 [Candidatus Doudnabacteria bacterium RIFCSPHIGHO2_02_FULL_43_13b]OGE94838.1 MAG: hypothetical protein A3B10_03550 [Candidatus Doudnabacteria bacterium RIFCSPLOWO2_01_FULL_44_21]